MSRGLMKALGITPQALHNDLQDKPLKELDQEMLLLREVLMVLDDELSLSEAKFCCLGDSVGLVWHRADKKAAIYVFVTHDDLQTRLDCVDGDFVFGVSKLSFKEKKPDMMRAFREEIRGNKKMFDEHRGKQ